MPKVVINSRKVNWVNMCKHKYKRGKLSIKFWVCECNVHINTTWLQKQKTMRKRNLKQSKSIYFHCNTEFPNSEILIRKENIERKAQIWIHFKNTHNKTFHTCKHGMKVRTTGSQHHSMSRDFHVFSHNCDITQQILTVYKVDREKKF